MKHSTTRRRFVVAAITFSGLASATIGVSVLRLSAAWARDDDVDEDTRLAMVRLARLLYPHDEIPNSVYAEVLDDALSATADSNGSFAKTLAAAEAALDARADGDFLELEEAEQIAALRAVESEDFFVAIHGVVGYRLYNNATVWQHIGYEGPSYQEGGYLHRGAGDIDWLDEGE